MLVRAGAIIATLLLAVAVHADAAPTPTATEVRDAVEDELITDLAVDHTEIDVHVEDGIVRLTGTVDTLLDRRRSADLAATVRGVRSVVNELLVVPPISQTDTELTDAVDAALLRDPATESYEVATRAANGTVTLSGTVDSWRERELAETVAARVDGVREIVNDIEVEHDATRTDAEIRRDVEAGLRWDANVDSLLIETTVDEGVVELTGTVGSFAELTRASSVAWVAGVREVDTSGLEVRSWARDEDRRTVSELSVTDAEIERAVNDALLRDPRVNSFDVASHSDGGLVTLRGTVDNLRAKQAAANDARNTFGVTAVRNRIRVRPVPDVENAVVEGNVRVALRVDSDVEADEIAVTADDGVVRLEGTVDSWFERAQADRVAATVEGVRRVENRLDVDRDLAPMVWEPYLDDPYVYDYPWYDFRPAVTWTSDARIASEIRDELWWSPFVDSDDVTVEVHDGVATLTGTVDSMRAYRAARENALEGGAIRVDNDLIVER